MTSVKARMAADILLRLSRKIRPYWPEIGRSSLCVLVSLLAVAFSICVPVVLQGNPWFTWPANWHYADSGTPMIVGADGYFFLSQASKAVSEGLSLSTPALSVLAVILRFITQASMENTVFYANLVFTVGFALLIRAWFIRLEASFSLSILACIILSIMPPWVQRTGPVWFDTDPAIVFFWQLEIFALTLAADLSRSFKTRLKDFGLAFIAFIFLVWFWNSGIFLGGVITLGYWLMFATPWKPLWRYKAFPALVTIAVIWFALIVFLPEQYVPFPTSLALEIRSKGAMVFGVERHFFFTSIQELAPISFPDLVARIGGFKVSGVIILISAAGAFFAHPKFRMPLVLGLCFLFAGLSSQRLIHIGCFSLAISVALLPKTLDFISDKFVKFTSKLKIAVPPPPVFGRISDTFSLSTFWAKVPRLSILAVPAIIVVILSCAWWTGHHSFPLRWNKLHDELFSPFRESGIKGASFCNWWDDGYFIMARSGQSAFFDGGSQNPDTTYAAARPWLMLDRVAAARWMRFFSRRGLNGLEPLEKIWGKEQAYAVLERFFLALEPNGSLRPGATYSGNLEADLARLPGGHTWLFPEGRVFVFFPKDIFGISAWWIAMGNSRPADSNLVRMHFSEISRNEFQHNKETGNVTLAQSVINRGQTSIGSAIDAAVTPISGPPWTVLNLPGPYIVYNSAYSTTFIVDQFGLVSLPLYLLLPGGPELPNFKLVKVNYQAGGIWEVLP